MENFVTTNYISKKKRRWPWITVGVLFCLLAYWGISFSHGPTFTIQQKLRALASQGGGDQKSAPNQPKIADDPEYAMPADDPNRLDILVMGMRGKDDPDGGPLTDTIMLFSMDKKTGRTALVSIPRDLTVRVTDDHTEKINTAYIYNGLDGTKKLMSRITGVPIDHIVVFDFTAFKYIVDTLGGINVYLDKPFSETQQWGYTFSLPAGNNTLNGDSALYYVRSRYGSSDFDRSRRQMQVIMAIKDKIASLNLYANPLKVLELATTVRKDIDTDMDIFDLATLKQLLSEGGSLDKIKRYQITNDNLCYDAMVNGIYELLPRGGTLQHIKDFLRTILNDTPVIDAPTLTPSPSASPTKS